MTRSHRRLLLHVSASLLLSLACQHTHACLALSVTLYVGATSEDIDNPSQISRPVGSAVWFRAAVDPFDNPNRYSLYYKFDFNNNGTWDKTFIQSWDSDNDYLTQITSQVYKQDPNNPDSPAITGKFNPKVEVILLTGQSMPPKANSQCIVWVVSVNSIQWKDGAEWVPIENTLYVMTGTTMQFRAIPEPDDAPWPQGKPVWGGQLSGSGSTVEKTFLGASPTICPLPTITAECGNVRTRNLVVYDFEGTFTPVDDFDDRSYNRFGVLEYVDLGCHIQPPGVTAQQIGGLKWSIAAGAGLFVEDPPSDGTAIYLANHIPEESKLNLTVQSGISSGRFKQYTKDIIAPSGTYMTRESDRKWHEQGLVSVGFRLYYFLTPKDVSFTRIGFFEGFCPSTNCWGWYNQYTPGPHMPWTPRGVLPGNIETGCQVQFLDTASFWNNSGGVAGGYTWDIPTLYAAGEHFWRPIGNVLQIHTMDDEGTARIEKGGHSVSAGFMEATQGY